MAVEVPSRSKRLTKAQAALMQIEAAIKTPAKRRKGGGRDLGRGRRRMSA